MLGFGAVRLGSLGVEVAVWGMAIMYSQMREQGTRSAEGQE